MKRGKLILIPSFLDESNDKNSIAPANLEIIKEIRFFIAENIRTARRFLKKIGCMVPFDQVAFVEIPKSQSFNSYETFLEPLMRGENVGLISEAGAPCIADPGAEIVRMAHECKLQVVPLGGYSSIIMALMSSGFNGQRFAFHGYLPVEKNSREQKIRELEKSVQIFDQTQIFMETPYRNNQMLDSLLRTLHPATMLSVAACLTNPEKEYIQTYSVMNWKKIQVNLHKNPAIFLIYREKSIR